jgi:hypothetical protein
MHDELEGIAFRARRHLSRREIGGCLRVRHYPMRCFATRRGGFDEHWLMEEAPGQVIPQLVTFITKPN